MLPRILLFVAVGCLACTGCGARSAPASSSPAYPTACPVTQEPSPSFVPPSAYLAQPPGIDQLQFWYGSAALWTRLTSEGVWAALPQHEEGYSQKVFWWSQDYTVEQEPVPALVVTGRRLDDDAPNLISSEATNALGAFGQAMLVGVTIPAPGCWEITGSYRGTELSFVVQVRP